MLSQHVIHERSSIIPINKNLTTYMKIDNKISEYSLKQNFFDPSKSSPPNDFMIKLHMRMNKYYFDNKDDNFDIK
jgi:hypothetical protein